MSGPGTHSLRIVALAVLSALFAAACQQAPSDGAGPADDDRRGSGLSVVASIFPLAWMSEALAPGADLTLLGQRGVEPHDLDISPREREAIAGANVVLYVGPIGFQPQVERAVRDATGAVVPIVGTVDPERLLHAGEDDHAEEPGHEVDQEEGVDPHVWFDARAMADVAVAIGETFAALDPAGGDEFRSRAQSLQEELLALAGDIDGLLDGCLQRQAIVSHEAYAYLLEPRGLGQLGIAGASPEAGASPRRLAELSRQIEERGMEVVLAEPFEGRADAEALAREAGLELVEIDPLEVVSAEDYARGYPALLREQAERFATALQCDG